MSRYNSDLAACRALAGNVDVQGATAAGAVGGVLLGAMLSAMVGGSAQQTANSASFGGFLGIGKEGGAASAKAQTVVINCMAGRGYRTLDGGNVVIVQQAGQGVAAKTKAPTPADTGSTAPPAMALSQDKPGFVGGFAQTMQPVSQAALSNR